MIDYLVDSEIYQHVILKRMFSAQNFLWVATADIKNMHIHKRGKMVSFLDCLSDLVEKRVEIRLLHAKEPGPSFRKDFDNNKNLIHGMERILCPRVHLKAIIVDGLFAYSGTANLTGAGMGAKNNNRRNFEGGFITDETPIIEKIMQQFDSIWMGAYCAECDRKKYCADFKDLI